MRVQAPREASGRCGLWTTPACCKHELDRATNTHAVMPHTRQPNAARYQPRPAGGDSSDTEPAWSGWRLGSVTC
jgi:hypothetical protein